MLPFALNQSTKFISPTKTLEYMAAERMIVSTPITDVAEPYGKIVYVASGAQRFMEACEHAMRASGPEKVERIRAMRDVLSRTSWDTTAGRMLNLIDKAMGSSIERDQAVTMVAPGWTGQLSFVPGD
jgi:hypothetical protein